MTTGTEDKLYNQYYVAEYRTYKGYDRGLKVGPYFFGYADNPVLVNWVDHFAYQDGLLINYWDTSQADNNTGLHPGQGLLLPVDAHPKTLYRVDGERLAQPHPDLRLHLHAGEDGRHPQHPRQQRALARPEPAGGVGVQRHEVLLRPDQPAGQRDARRTRGRKITISSISAIGGFMQIQVAPVK